MLRGASKREAAAQPATAPRMAPTSSVGLELCRDAVVPDSLICRPSCHSFVAQSAI